MAMDPMPTNQLINSHVIFTRVGVGLAHTVQVLGLMCLASSSISISISFHGTNYLMLLLFQLQLTNHRTTLCQKKKKRNTDRTTRVILLPWICHALFLSSLTFFYSQKVILLLRLSTYSQKTVNFVHRYF